MTHCVVVLAAGQGCNREGDSHFGTINGLIQVAKLVSRRHLVDATDTVPENNTQENVP